MILNESEALARLESPHNLMNRLRSASSSRGRAMGLFGVGNNKDNINSNIRDNKTDSAARPLVQANPSIINPFQVVDPSSQVESVELTRTISSLQQETSVENLIENAEDQVKLTLAHNNALKVLNNAVEMLATKLDDIKPEKLPAVIGAASKVVESIRKERLDMAKTKDQMKVKINFYTPTPKKMEDYNVIEVG